MARMIDADKRIAEIKKIYCDGCDNYGGDKCRACWVDDAMCLIDDAPTVDEEGRFVGICEHCAYREDCEWPKIHPKIKLKECPDFNKGDKK